MNAKIPTSQAEFIALAQEDRREEHGEDVLAGLHRGHRLVRRDELRLRLRRKDRDHAQGQVGRHARQAGRARRPRRVQAVLRRRSRGLRRRPTRRTRTRTTSWPRATPRRRTEPAWFTCCVGDYKNRVAQFVMPSHTKGQPIPGFLGGSDLAVPIGANKDGRRGVDQRLHRQRVDDRAAREGEHPEHDEPARKQRQRARGTQELVRPDRRRTGSTSRTGTSSARCCSGSSPASPAIKDAASVASDNITYTLNQ